jgi:hypothetical protein
MFFFLFIGDDPLFNRIVESKPDVFYNELNERTRDSTNLNFSNRQFERGRRVNVNSKRSIHPSENSEIIIRSD